MRSTTEGRRGVTLIELVVVTGIIAVLAGVAIPRASRIMDRINVDGAARHAAMVFVTARQTAIARSTFASVRINPAATTMHASIGDDTIVARNLGEMFGVTMTANRDSVSYSPIGLGYGAANLSLIIKRGRVVDTVVTSRLGRVRK